MPNGRRRGRLGDRPARRRVRLRQPRARRTSARSGGSRRTNRRRDRRPVGRHRRRRRARAEEAPRRPRLRRRRGARVLQARPDPPRLLRLRAAGVVAARRALDLRRSRGAHARRRRSPPAGSAFTTPRRSAAASTLDPTQDLARLMRVPGTVNGKGGMEALVRGWPDPIAEQDGPRYQLEELARWRSSTRPPPSRSRSPSCPVGIELRADADLPVHEARGDPRQRRRVLPNVAPPAPRGAGAGMDAVRVRPRAHDPRRARRLDRPGAREPDRHAHRRQNGDVDKAMRDRLRRPDRSRRPAPRPTAPSASATATTRSTSSQAQTEAGAPADAEATIATFNRLLPTRAPAVKRAHQGRHRAGRGALHARPRRTPQEVRLGGGKNLLNQDRFREAFMDVTSFVISSVKRPAWETAIQALLDVAVVRESPRRHARGRRRRLAVAATCTSGSPHRPGEDYKAEACKRTEPFREDGCVFVYASSFGAFVRAALRVNRQDKRSRRCCAPPGSSAARSTTTPSRAARSVSTRLLLLRGPAEVLE
jgi:hypothetical protein